MSSSVGKGKHKSSTSSSIIVFCIATYAATVLQCAGLARQRCSTQPPGQNHFRCLREKKTHTHTCQAVILAQQGQPWQDQESKKEFPFWAVEWKVGRMPPPVTLSLHFRALFFFFYYLKHLHLLLLGLETSCLKSHTWSAPRMNKKKE